MTAPPEEPAVVGLCNCCDAPVLAGDELHVEVHRATGAAPDLLLHRQPCRPVMGRRWMGRSYRC